MNWAGNNEPPKIWNTIKGNALNVRTKEGVGMGKFYGEMTPEGYQSGIVGTRLQKLVKGLDPEAARVEPTDINTGKSRTISTIIEQDLGHRGPINEEWINRAAPIFEQEVNRGHRASSYPSIPITPAMREKILKEGLPLFNVAALSAPLSRILGQGQTEGEDGTGQ
jgi:hypothetical protein